MSDDVLLSIQRFCADNGCPAIVQYDGVVFVSGPEEFARERSPGLSR